MGNRLKKFFVMEGIDGAGTTTQAKKLSSYFADGFFQCEPTEGVIGRYLREILAAESKVDKVTLSYLFAADRSDHLYKPDGILALSQRNTVVCDRYILSSYAYQSLDADSDFVVSLNETFPAPEATFFIDTDVDICMERIGKREKREIYEYIELQRKIRENYLRGIEVYRKRGWDIKIIDGDQEEDRVFETILSSLSKKS